MCWCTPTKRTPWCPNCNTVFVTQMADDPKRPLARTQGALEERISSLYFWLGADAERG